MAILTPVYCTRQDVKRALDVHETARSNGQVDRAVEAASRTIEGVLHRRFYPNSTPDSSTGPTRSAPGRGGCGWTSMS